MVLVSLAYFRQMEEICQAHKRHFSEDINAYQRKRL